MIIETRILKTEDADEQRMIFAEVYAPNRPDSQGEYMTAETIRKMAHAFVKTMKVDQIDTEHDNIVLDDVTIVESFIARKGDPDFLEGAWVVGIHIEDDDTWEAVKKGEINGLSMEAVVFKETKEVELSIPPVVRGLTTKSEDHDHEFFVTYDKDGKFLGGTTNMVDGHVHPIVAGTVTEKVNGHSHRFSSVDGVEITQ